MDIEKVTEENHEELLKLLTPLIKFLDLNEYRYFINIGQDGLCSRYMRGKHDDIVGILTGMASKNNDVKNIILECANDLIPTTL